jgi:hypothetical protein
VKADITEQIVPGNIVVKLVNFNFLTMLLHAQKEETIMPVLSGRGLFLH